MAKFKVEILRMNTKKDRYDTQMIFENLGAEWFAVYASATQATELLAMVTDYGEIKDPSEVVNNFVYHHYNSAYGAARVTQDGTPWTPEQYAACHVPAYIEAREKGGNSG